MRSIAISTRLSSWCLCSVLLGSALATACVQEERVPVGTSRPGATVVTTSHLQQQPGATNAQPAQPANPPIINNVVEPPPTLNVAPPAYGVTEAQPSERTRPAEVLALVSQQMDRLTRMQSTTTGTHREDIDSTLSDLRTRRDQVLQDLRELEMQPADRRADVQKKLDADVATLQDSLSGSYNVAPPPSRGMPEPSPIAPSQVR